MTVIKLTENNSEMGLLGLVLIGLIGAEKINVCYYTSWAQYRTAPENFVPENIDVSLCSHIHYAFGFVTDDGTTLRMFEWNDEDMYRRVMALRSQRAE